MIEDDLSRMYKQAKSLRRQRSVSELDVPYNLSLSSSSDPTNMSDLVSQYNSVAAELADVQERIKHYGAISSDVPADEQRDRIIEFRRLVDEEKSLRNELNRLISELDRSGVPAPKPPVVISSERDVRSATSRVEEDIKKSEQFNYLTFDQSRHIGSLIEAGSEYRLKSSFTSLVDDFARTHGAKNYMQLSEEDADELISILEDKLDEAKSNKEDKEKESNKDTSNKKEDKEKDKKEEENIIKKANDILDSYKKYYSDLAHFVESGDYEHAVECYSDMEKLWYDLEDLGIPPAYRFASGVPSPQIVKAMFSIDTLTEAVRSGIRSDEDIEKLEEKGNLTGRLKRLVDRIESIRV